MANYSEKDKQAVRNLFQSLVITREIGISEIVDGLALPDYSARAERVIGYFINMLPSFDFDGVWDCAKLEKGLDSIGDKMAAIAFHDDLCKLLTEQDIHNCLKHHIDFSAMLANYEKEQAEERAGWKSKLDCADMERASDIRRTWKS
ncbi:MAG: hypothetical protein V4563_17755 [Pseudomonadota bacterium]